MKVFISVGMSGRLDREVVADLHRAYRKIIDRFGYGYQVVDNFSCEPSEDPMAGRLYYLGKAIEKLGDCDICYFTKGWQNYRGCRAEMEICKIYGIEVIEEA